MGERVRKKKIKWNSWVEINLFSKIEKRKRITIMNFYIYVRMYITRDAQAIAHHPLTDAQLSPCSTEEPELPLPSKLLPHNVIWYGIPPLTNLSQLS